MGLGWPAVIHGSLEVTQAPGFLSFPREKKQWKKEGVWAGCEGPVSQLRWDRTGMGDTPGKNSTSTCKVARLFTDPSPLPVAQYAGTEMARLARERKTLFLRAAKLVTQESKLSTWPLQMGLRHSWDVEVGNCRW